MRKIASFSLIALLFVAWTAFKPNKPEHQGLHIGEMAPDFNLKNIDGKMLGLKDIKADKGYIVIFTCNHCPFSKAYEDRIIDIDKKYKKMGCTNLKQIGNKNTSTYNEEQTKTEKQR
jgi:peroxiredoxin